jgi:osmotically-inducible protein OsmY
MNRFPYFLAILSLIVIPCASSQTWELGKDGSAKQTQTATSKGTKGQSGSDQASPKGQNKTSNSDDDLKQAVNQKFGTDAALRYILVEVQKGNVTLSGTVPSKADKKRAVQLAKLVPGVHKVHDSLSVDANASSSGDNEPTNARNTPPKPKTTASARPRTKPALTTAHRNGSATDAASGMNAKSVVSGDAGKTEAPAEHLGSSPAGGGGISGAVASASTTAGGGSAPTNSGAVSTATNNVDFSAVPVPLMRPLASTATLKGQIENALRNDSQVGSSNLNVNVTDTTIELSGNVPSGKERTAAYRIAQSFAFNRHVQDHMTVTGRSGVGANSPTHSGDGNSSKPAVGSASTPNVPKSNATADGNAFALPRL